MQFEDQVFEVTFTAEDGEIIATCNVFPDCKGIGGSEKEALQKLSKSITSFISRMTKKSMDQLLLSEQYTEVISDPYEKSNIQKRLYSTELPNKNTTPMKERQVNLRAIQMLDDQVHPESVVPADVKSIFEQAPSEEELVDGLISFINNQNPQPKRPESFGFGFAISYN